MNNIAIKIFSLENEIIREANGKSSGYLRDALKHLQIARKKLKLYTEAQEQQLDDPPRKMWKPWRDNPWKPWP